LQAQNSPFQGLAPQHGAVISIFSSSSMASSHSCGGGGSVAGSSKIIVDWFLGFETGWILSFSQNLTKVFQFSVMYTDK